MGEKPSVFITGAARGIGLATAKLFLERGWYVGLYDLDLEVLTQVQSELTGGAYRMGRIDVTQPDSVKEALEDFVEHAGNRLDVLVNNAGIAFVGEFEDKTLAEYHDLIDVNVKGPVNCTYAALPWLIGTSKARIVNLASASALYGNPELTVYAATKSAVVSLTEGWNVGLSQYDIHVAAVMPIYVHTRMVHDHLHEYRRLALADVKLTVEDVAGVIWRAATGPKRTVWHVGSKTKLFSFISRFMTHRMLRWLTRREMGYFYPG